MNNTGIGLVGAGAVGSLIAAALCANGHSFTWVERDPGRRAELSALAVQFPTGGRDYDLAACHLISNIGDLPPCRIIILAVKAHDIAEVLSSLKGQDGAEILVIANGLITGGHHLGLLYGGAFIQSGVLVCGDDNRLEIGLLGGGESRSKELSRLLEVPFLSCRPEKCIRERMWHKLAMNCVINPLTTMLDCENGYLIGHLGGPFVRELVREIAGVIAAEAAGEFQPPSRTELLEEIKQLVRRTKDNSSSMREDLRAGRSSEIDALNTAVAQAGSSHGIACPVNETTARMISYLFDRGSSQRGVL